MIRDSQSFPGAFGLAVKVAVPPAHVLQGLQGDMSKFIYNPGVRYCQMIGALCALFILSGPKPAEDIYIYVYIYFITSQSLTACIQAKDHTNKMCNIYITIKNLNM